MTSVIGDDLEKKKSKTERDQIHAKFLFKTSFENKQSVLKKSCYHHLIYTVKNCLFVFTSTAIIPNAKCQTVDINFDLAIFFYEKFQACDIYDVSRKGLKIRRSS